MYRLELWQRSIWQKDSRFYRLELCQDLFGNWIVQKTWGSAVKLDYGRTNSIICPDYQTGLREYQKLQIRRQLRGYINLELSYTR